MESDYTSIEVKQKFGLQKKQFTTVIRPTKEKMLSTNIYTFFCQTRITVLPKIYDFTDRVRWEDIYHVFCCGKLMIMMKNTFFSRVPFRGVQVGLPQKPIVAEDPQGRRIRGPPYAPEWRLDREKIYSWSQTMYIWCKCVVNASAKYGSVSLWKENNL